MLICKKCDTPNKDGSLYCAACNSPLKPGVPPNQYPANGNPATLQKQVLFGVFWGIFLSGLTLGAIGYAASEIKYALEINRIESAAKDAIRKLNDAIAASPVFTPPGDTP